MAESGDANHGGGRGVIDHDGAEAHQHRRARVAESVEGGRENFQRGVSGEADCIVGERESRAFGVVQSEAAALIDGSDDGFSQDDETHRRGQGEEKDHA